MRSGSCAICVALDDLLGFLGQLLELVYSVRMGMNWIHFHIRSAGSSDCVERRLFLQSQLCVQGSEVETDMAKKSTVKTIVVKGSGATVSDGAIRRVNAVGAQPERRGYSA